MKKQIMTFLLVNLLSVIFTVSIFSAPSLTFDDVCKKLSEHPNTTGDFSQVRTITKLNRSLTSNGKFIFSLDGIMWKTEKPFPSTLIVGMSSITQITQDGKKSVIDASSNQIFTSISTTLSSVFSGDAKKLYDSFSVDFSSTGNKWQAVLTPKDKTITAVMKTLSLGGTMTADIAEFDTIVLTESSGDTIKYTFTNKKYPKELSSDEKSMFKAK